VSTRGLLAFHVDGETKASYNHADSYPSSLGIDALRYLRTVVDTELGVETLRETAARLKVVSNAVRPTPEEIDALGRYAERGYDDGRLDNWYVLLHATQGDPQHILAAGYVENSFEFGYDGLFCEHGYVIDLDARTFDVYRGFSRGDVEGLWAERPAGQRDTGFGSVTRVASFPFENLPSDEEFLERLAKEG